jgi:hypothetical protein
MIIMIGELTLFPSLQPTLSQSSDWPRDNKIIGKKKSWGQKVDTADGARKGLSTFDQVGIIGTALFLNCGKERDLPTLGMHMQIACLSIRSR